MTNTVKTSGFINAINYDFSEAFAISNPAKSATLTLLIQENGVGKADSVIQQKIIKTLSKTGTSGGKAEGANAGENEKSTRTTVKNVCEIFSKVASVSGTAKALNSALYAEELNDRIAEIKEDINTALINGTYSDSDPFKMKGLSKTTTNKVTIANEVLTEAELDEAIQKLGTKGNVYLAVNPVNMLAVQRALIGDKAAIQLSTSSTQAGINITSYISAQGVNVSLYPETALTAGTYLLFDIDKVEYRELRPVHVEELAKQGDADRALVVGQVTNLANPASIVSLATA